MSTTPTLDVLEVLPLADATRYLMIPVLFKSLSDSN